MKKSYEKPSVMQNGSFTEGVYMASGSSCYTVTANIHQKPETGRGDYRIQVDAVHSAEDGHTNEKQTLTIKFNLPVTYSKQDNSGGTLISGDGTDTLVIGYSYHNNASDNIGLGDLVVTADAGLAIIEQSLTMTDGH